MSLCRGLAISTDDTFARQTGQTTPRPERQRHSKRVLLFHMGGVLGHLNRVLALAEEIDAAGHEAILATSDGGLPIFQALNPGVRRVEAYDDPILKNARALLTSTAGGRRGDRSNLHGMGPQDSQGKSEIARQMARTAAADRALIEHIEPDAIVVDHRFTGWAADRGLRDRTFHISALLGLPSLHKRVTGRLPYPLQGGRLLVPGIREIECWHRKDPPAAEPGRIALCGLFRWQGWAQLRGSQATLPRTQALFFFGSTGDGARAKAALGEAAEGWLNYRWVGNAWCGAVDAAGEPAVDLESGLAGAELLICHGGHGTVMEALLHERPVIVIPSNPEQLEIGHRLEKMGLGLLVRQRVETITRAGLAELIASVSENARMQRRVKRYSALLRQKADGAKHAAAIVLEHIGANLSGSKTAK